MKEVIIRYECIKILVLIIMHYNIRQKISGINNEKKNIISFTGIGINNFT